MATLFFGEHNAFNVMNKPIDGAPAVSFAKLSEIDHPTGRPLV
jgi:hypothetical protein